MYIWWSDGSEKTSMSSRVHSRLTLSVPRIHLDQDKAASKDERRSKLPIGEHISMKPLVAWLLILLINKPM